MSDLITEAFSVSGSLPTRERLVELHGLLRAEVDRLMPIVQKLTDDTDRGSRDWYAMDSALAYTRDVMAEELGEGPLAATLLVREVARRIHALRKHAGEEPS